MTRDVWACGAQRNLVNSSGRCNCLVFGYFDFSAHQQSLLTSAQLGCGQPRPLGSSDKHPFLRGWERGR